MDLRLTGRTEAERVRLTRAEKRKSVMEIWSFMLGAGMLPLLWNCLTVACSSSVVVQEYER